MRQFILVCLSLIPVNSYENTLADCLAVAGKFDNTCADMESPIDFRTHSGQTVECIGEIFCPEGNDLQTYTQDSTCSWQRKMCVTCSQRTEGSEDVVYIRVQTNSLPDSCYGNVERNPKETETDWTVEFNRDVKGIVNHPYGQVETNLGI